MSDVRESCCGEALITPYLYSTCADCPSPMGASLARIQKLEGEREALRGKLRQAVDALRQIRDMPSLPEQWSNKRGELLVAYPFYRQPWTVADEALREMEGSAEG